MQMEGVGYKIGDVCYSTVSHTANGKSIVLGSRGIVAGPCSNPSLKDADQQVKVKFDSGVAMNMNTKTQIRTAAAQVHTAQA